MVNYILFLYLCKQKNVMTMKKTLMLLALAFCGAVHADTKIDSDVLSVEPQQEEVAAEDSVKKKSFVDKLPQPFRWIIKNWSDNDPQYSLSSFYNWAAQLQNSTTFEWVHMDTPEGMHLDMRSKISNRLGPYFGWRFLFFGTTIDLNSIGHKSKRKNEFTLSINSNLVNIDLIRRRTGGDFIIKKLEYNDPTIGTVDVKDVIDEIDGFDMGDYIKNSLTGFNLNYFINHRKYSNPAAFSNGAVQLRSVGSPIVGLGYMRQKVECDMSDVFTALGSALLIDENFNPIMTEERIDRLGDLEENDPEVFHNEFAQVLKEGFPNISLWGDFADFNRSILTNRIPTETVIDDWHLQLGYAYNLVFSRRLLLGISAIISPSLKHVRANNKNSIAYEFAEELGELTHKSPDDYRYFYNDTHFNLNAFLRASLTFNFNRWRAGFNGSFSNYFYKNKGMKVNNGFGNVDVYVGYCFGRKKDYRHNGALRKDYIMAALTPRQIEEMKDTMPESNIEKGASYLATMGKTRLYHHDVFELGIVGCDLVLGPEGKYGWYEITDGYVTPRQDTEGRLDKGKVIDIDKNGRFVIEAGHDSNFRTGNWWKSKLALNQIPNQWYPEMLHYAMCGKLTLYLRGRIFGTKKPVKFELDNFFLNHGRETNNFYQVGVKSFRSHSAYSIEGRVEVNDRLFRVYIEQKKQGKFTQMYISRIVPVNAEWMGKLDGSKPLSYFSVPGTHDAGTASLFESAAVNTAHTQNFSVSDQLADGVRAFDIRLKPNLKYGHMFTCREGFDSTMVKWDQFLTEHPTEVIIAMIGVDGGGKWGPELTKNYKKLIAKYPHRFVEKFDAKTTLDEVRGKILVIRRQEDCPFGKLLKFSDNAVFDYDCFHVEDVYKEHKTWKKADLVEQHIREAYENDDPNKWFITFNSVAWSPRRHIPYAYAWGGKAKNIRKPLNKTLRETIELKDYTNFGIVFLDFYNDHGEHPQLMETIIGSNFHIDEE
jgi:hypothetical protein